MIERLPRSFLSADLAVVLVGRAALACPSRTCHNRPSTLPRRDDDGPEKGGEEWFIEVPNGGRSKSRPNCWSFAFLADGWDPPIRISLLSLPPAVKNSHMMMLMKRRFKKLFDVKIEEGSDDGRNHFRCRNLGESEDGAGLRFSAERRIFLRWLHL